MSTLTQPTAVAAARTVVNLSLLLASGAACGTSTRSSMAPAPVMASAAADTGTQDTLVSATMLRVLAETADEFRTGAPVFLVAAYQFPHKVLGGFQSRAEADSARAAAGGGHGVFGPYVTPEDEIPDSAAEVISVRLEIETAGGREVVVVDPERVDALFFSQSAYDKFVVPYYAGIYGPEYALRQREIFMRKRPPGHCLSRMCLIMEDGAVDVEPYLPPPPP